MNTLMGQLNFWGWLYVCLLADTLLIFILLLQWHQFWKLTERGKIAVAVFTSLFFAIFGKNYADDFTILVYSFIAILIASSSLWLTVKLALIAKRKIKEKMGS